MTVIYPGSFDPPTNGHINVMNRASRLFDQVEVVISVNTQKQCFLSAEERFELISTLTAELKNVHVNIWEGLIVEFARKIDSKVVLRGVRALSDFDYEFELSMIYKALDPEIETIFLPTDQRYFVLRSSTIRELAMFKGDITAMVPPLVAKAIESKIK